MVLLKAHDSSAKRWPSTSGEYQLPDDAPTEWAVLQELAINIENDQARQEIAPGVSQPLFYQDLVHTVVSLFSERHTSLFRQISTVREKTGETTEKMHRRWSDTTAFLQDAKDHQKLVLDDGVKQLLYELKKYGLRYSLKGLKPATDATGLMIPHDHRTSTVREMFVRLSLAHGGWAAAHVQKYIPSDSTHQTDSTRQSIYKDSSVPLQTRLQLAAKKLENHVVRLVEKDRSGKVTSDVYGGKVEVLRKLLIDDLIEQLKSAVVGRHRAKNVNVVMRPKDFSSAASRKRPNEIEQIQAPESGDKLEEPLVKRICYRGVKNVSPDLAAPPSWLGMVDGKLDEFT